MTGEPITPASRGSYKPIGLQVEPGKTLRNVDFRFAQFKKGTWKNLTYLDGLADNYVTSIYRDPDGTMWFGTFGGVSRYDGKEFKNLTEKDGLADDVVHAIYRDAGGVMRFATWGGVSRYDARGMGDFPHFVNLTTQDGLVDNRVRAIHQDADGVMWFATWGGGISRCDGRGVTTGDFPHFVNFTTEDGLANDDVYAIHQDADGVMWFATWRGGVSRYDGKSFINFTKKDGLADNRVQAIYRDTESVMWFATEGGVSRYDTKTFLSLTTKDGLTHNDVSAIHHASDNVMWFGTWGGGISRYDGKSFSNLTTEDGLVNNAVATIHRAPDGAMWFGTWQGGVSRYDGESFTNLTTEDGLVDDIVRAICSEPDGVMWFGTFGGVSRYDGQGFTNFTTEDGVPDNTVNALHRSPDGTLWIGTGRGVSCYDGKSFPNLTTKDGLVSNLVLTVYGEPDGVVWFGTHGGVSRYDGKRFSSFTTEDGLVKNAVVAIHIDPEGKLWFGTSGGGVACYDGIAWTSLDTRDGLAKNVVRVIHRDTDGGLWFATEGGITRYRRSGVSPKARIVSVTADRTYFDLDAIPAFTPGTRITMEYSSIDFVTVPEKRQYRCRIHEAGGNEGNEEMKGNEHTPLPSRSPAPPYLPPTKETTFDWIPEKPGEYIFEVQAIDRDLNYSEPAMVSLTVQPDPVLVSMQAELSHLRREVGQKYHFESIVGRSVSIMQVRALMERAIDSGLTVLITGETGTGKELVAKAIHHNSQRRDRPMLALNCGAVAKELITSSLFGHRKGAFTSAHEDQIGLFEAASGGTVLLDEISEMPQDAQIHLLRVLEERKVQRLGEHFSRDVDVRIIAMTNRDLMKEVTAGQFREDLYYRLSVFPIGIPPLRERPEDAPLLAEHFLQEIDKELDGFAPDVFQMLQGYSWPGNVRELRNAVHRATALAEEGKQIQTYHFPPEITQGESLIQDIVSGRIGLSASVEQLQRRLIENALRECNGNHTYAARMLKMHRSNFVRLMRRLGIEYPDVPK